MSLLMPELERQLRAAVRARRAERRGGRAERRGGRRGGWVRGRARIPRFGGILVVLAATSALAVAVLAVVLIGHGGQRATPAVSPGRITHVQSCVTRATLLGGALPLPPSGAQQGSATIPLLSRSQASAPLVMSAAGSIDGRSWTLALQRRADPELVEQGDLLLGRRAYGVCANQFDLIAAKPHGILYGFITYRGDYSIRLEKVTGGSTAVTRKTKDGTFFIQALPKSACAYHSLGLVIDTKGASSVDSLRFGRCVANDLVPSVEPKRSSINVLPVPPPAGLSAAHRSEFLVGRGVVTQTGCLACHQIGALGNGGVGPNLGDVGRSLSTADIERALLHPHAPMPSVKSLPRRQLRALIYFLSRLRNGG
jgi:hypothetical protein